ncbi:hypothetical protein F5Y16DRAFT_404346 [Xylariaceae sp. FL0255]|nr:hypothetical protein F5Y16DRAFT_404346 [Xylariaceae sp. FL0255]
MTSVYSPAIQTTSELGGEDGGIATGLPPLLTIFNPPSYCVSQWYYDPATPGTVWSDNSHDLTWYACQPFSATLGIYSPGICPSGQEFKEVTKVFQSTGTVSTQTYYNGACCSSSFTWTTLYAGFTTSNKPLVSTITGCFSSFKPPLSALVARSNGDAFVTVLNSPVVAVGTHLEIFWHESDLSSFSAPLTASLRAAMGLPAYTTTFMSNGTASPGASQPTTTSTSSSGSKASLSKGAIAGISTGVVIVFLVITTLGYLAFSRRWKRRSPRSYQYAQAPPGSPGYLTKFSRLSRIAKWKRYVEPGVPDASQDVHPYLPEMDQGDNIHKHFSGGAWRSELGGAHTHSRNRSDGTAVSELSGGYTHSRNPSDGSQTDRRISYYTGSTAIGAVMELPGSEPMHHEAIPEAREE